MSKMDRPIRAVSFIVLITIVVKFLGYIRVSLVAKYFGTGIEASAFEASYAIPEVLFTSIGAALSTTFIPVFMQHLSRDSKEEAVKFTRNVVNILLVVTIILSIVGVGLAPLIVKVFYPGFHGEIYYTTVSLVRIMFPIIIFIAVSFTYVGVLQSQGEFNIPAALSLPSNIINIIYLIFLSSIFGIYGFAVAVLVGWSSQVLIQIPALKKLGFLYKPVLSFKDEGIKKMFVLAGPVLMVTMVQQVSFFISNGIASGLGNSAISVLRYAFYLYTIIVGVFTYALSAVVFPTLSKMHADNNNEQLKSLINKAIKAIIFVLFPVMVGLMILKVPIIRVLLERGKFTHESTQITAMVLFYYSIGALGLGVQEILNKVFYAIGNTKTPMVAGIFGAALNIVLNITLVRYLGVGGLALSTSITALFVMIILIYKLSHTIPGLIEKNTIALGMKVAFSSAIMGAVVFFSYTFLQGNAVTDIKTTIVLISSTILGISIYLLMNYILKTEEVLIFAKILKNKLALRLGKVR